MVMAQDLGRRVLIDDFVVCIALLITTSNNLKNNAAKSASHNISLDKQTLNRIIFRIYDTQNQNKLERNKLENILLKVYGAQYISKIKQFLDTLFSKSYDRILTQRDFESFPGDLTLMSNWIVVIITQLISPLSPNLLQAEQKYSAALELNEMIKRYDLPDTLYLQLRHTFSTICTDGPRPEMDLFTWLELTKSILSPPLANVIFCSKVKTIKLTWRFAEFLEFCAVFGGSSSQAKAAYLVEVFLIESEKVLKGTSSIVRVLSFDQASPRGNDVKGRVGVEQSFTGSTFKVMGCTAHMNRMIRLLSFTDAMFDSQSPINSARDGQTMQLSRRGSFLYSPLTATRIKSTRVTGNRGTYDSPRSLPTATGGDLNLPYEWEPFIIRRALPDDDIQRQIDNIEAEARETVDIAIYRDLITKCSTKLTAILDLELIACCLFGFKPASPAREGELIEKMAIRCQAASSASRTAPLGPVGTKWCILNKEWYGAWKDMSGFTTGNLTNMSSKVAKRSDKSLGPINNQVERRIIIMTFLYDKHSY